MARPVLLLGRTQTLSFDVPESGPGRAVSAATVSVFDENGAATTIAGATATVTDATGSESARLSVSVPSTVADALGDNYRAEWAYTVGSESVTRPQTFEVRRHALRPTLSPDTFFASHFPILKSRVPNGTTARTALATAWERLLAEVRAASGKSPHLIVDPEPLELAHANFAAATIAKTLGFGSASGGATEQQWAADREADAKEALRIALANVSWIDTNEDALPSAGEENRSASAFRFSR